MWASFPRSFGRGAPTGGFKGRRPSGGGRMDVGAAPPSPSLAQTFSPFPEFWKIQLKGGLRMKPVFLPPPWRCWRWPPALRRADSLRLPPSLPPLQPCFRSNPHRRISPLERNLLRRPPVSPEGRTTPPPSLSAAGTAPVPCGGRDSSLSVSRRTASSRPWTVGQMGSAGQ